VSARTVEGRTLYVNTTNAPASIAVSSGRKDALGTPVTAGKLTLPGYGVALIE
jgi:beta-galactosidase